MKKKILFVIPSLDVGGAEKSLVNLLQSFDFEKYDIDVILFKKRGLFLSMLPHEVNVSEISGKYVSFTKPLTRSLKDFVKKRNLLLFIYRLIYSWILLFNNNKAKAEQKVWKYIAKSIPELSKNYDVAIGYLEKSSIYFLVDKVKADKKIGWIHTIYSSSGLNPNFDKTYFENLNYIVTVSEECKNDFLNSFKNMIGKVLIIHNIINRKTVSKLAEEGINENALLNPDTKIVSVGRLSREKGIDLSIQAANILKAKNIKFTWYVIGDGFEKNNLLELISSLGLKNEFLLLGLKANPYPYIDKADVFVQSSRYEGKSIAIEEAKILCKPIVVTNFASVNDQLTHNKNALIAEMNPESIANRIIDITSNNKLKDKLLDELCNDLCDNSKEIKKLYNILET